MPIADHRKIQIVYNTGCHLACGGQFLTPHTVRSCPASLSHQANDHPMCYQFFSFWPWDLPLGQSSPKGEKQNFIAICQPMPKISFTKYPADIWLKIYKETSTPVVRTGVYPHMPIAVTTNSLQHWSSPSKRRPVSYMVRDGWASLSHRANDRRRCYRFFNFWPWWAYPWSKGHQKQRRPTAHLDLPSYKISARLPKCSTRYALPNFSLFGLRGANPWDKVHQKGRWPGELCNLPPYKISLPYVHPRPRYPLPKFLRTNKQTVTDISLPCLSACGDNKQ